LQYGLLLPITGARPARIATADKPGARRQAIPSADQPAISASEIRLPLYRPITTTTVTSQHRRNVRPANHPAREAAARTHKTASVITSLGLQRTCCQIGTDDSGAIACVFASAIAAATIVSATAMLVIVAPETPSTRSAAKSISANSSIDLPRNRFQK